MFDFLFRREDPFKKARPPGTPPQPEALPEAHAPANGSTPAAPAKVSPAAAAASSSMAAGMYDGDSKTHPLVQKIVDGPASPEHSKELAAAKQAVIGENKERGIEAAKHMAGDTKDTLVQTLILGGGSQAALDAATLPGQIKSAVGVAMGADPWSTYGDARVGQTGNQLLPHKPGDPAQAKPGLQGMAVQPAALSPDPDKEYLRSSELSLATAETQRQSGVPFVPGKPVGPIELRDPDNAEGWPAGAKAKVQIKTQVPGADGKMVDHVETVFTTETVDVAVGPGPSRKFAKDQMAEKDRGPLESWKQDPDGKPIPPQVQYAEEFLGTPGAADGKDVLVYGGGDTSAWCSEAARDQGAKKVEWAARPGKPDAMEKDASTGKMKKTAFGEIEDKIKECVGATPPREVPPELREQYKGEMDKYADKKRDEIKKMEEDLAALQSTPGADPKKIAELIESRDRNKMALEPHGVAKDRNKATNADKDGIQQSAADVLNVRPDPDGSGKVVVTMISPTGEIMTRKVDKVVGSMGQDANQPGGPVELCKNVPAMKVIWDGNSPVGLESDPPGVRVLGASAWAVANKLPPDELKKYKEAVRRRSLVDVSKDSRGVDIGFEAMGDNPARANAKLGKHMDEEAEKKAAEEMARAGSAKAVS
jgi:hypothetical protein